jgi:hypothetical protein
MICLRREFAALSRNRGYIAGIAGVTVTRITEEGCA